MVDPTYPRPYREWEWRACILKEGKKTPTPKTRFSIWTLLRTPGRFTTRPLPVHFATKISVVRPISVLTKDEISGSSKRCFWQTVILLGWHPPFSSFSSISGSEEQNPLFLWAECNIRTSPIFVKTTCFRQGTKRPFSKTTVSTTLKIGPQWGPGRFLTKAEILGVLGVFSPLSNYRAITVTAGTILKEAKKPSLGRERQFWRGILRDNLREGNCESKIAARQWGVDFCREASRCLAGPSGWNLGGFRGLFPPFN